MGTIVLSTSQYWYTNLTTVSASYTGASGPMALLVQSPSQTSNYPSNVWSMGNSTNAVPSSSWTSGNTYLFAAADNGSSGYATPGSIAGITWSQVNNAGGTGINPIRLWVGTASSTTTGVLPITGQWAAAILDQIYVTTTFSSYNYNANQNTNTISKSLGSVNGLYAVAYDTVANISWSSSTLITNVTGSTYTPVTTFNSINVYCGT